MLQDYIFSLQTEAAPYKKSEMKNAMGKISLRQFTTYRWVLFAMAGALYFMVCFHRLTPTVIARDLVFSLHADAVTLGIIASAYFYLYSGVQPIVGYLSDTVGPRKIMSLFFVLAGNRDDHFRHRRKCRDGRSGKGAARRRPGRDLHSQPETLQPLVSRGTIYWPDGDHADDQRAWQYHCCAPANVSCRASRLEDVILGIGIFSFVLAASCWMIVRDSPEEKGWTGFGHDYSPSSEREPTLSGTSWP